MEGITLAQAQESGLLGKLCRRIFNDEHKPVSKMDDRTANCLKNAGIEAFALLVVRSEGDLLKTKNVGRKQLNELKNFLLDDKLRLGMVFAGDLTDHLNAWLAEMELPALDSWLPHFYPGSPSHRQTLPPEPDPSAPKLSDTVLDIQRRLKEEIQRLTTEIGLLQMLDHALELGLGITTGPDTPLPVQRFIERVGGSPTREQITERIRMLEDRRKGIAIAFENIRYRTHAFDRVLAAIARFEKKEDD